MANSNCRQVILHGKIEKEIIVMKKRIFTFLAVLATLILLTSSIVFARTPKYVFFFLGDGMSNSQIQVTEAYLTQFNGGNATVAEDLLKSENRLNMSKMQVTGMQTTYDSFALMTDSASSATAFACGIKTKSGTIGMDNTATTSYKSVAQLAHEKGMKVGVISSVSLNHATPAAYYASVQNRGDYVGIAEQMAATGYEFFGGGGINKINDLNDVKALFSDYTVLNDRNAIIALKNSPQDRVLCINPWLQDSQAMPYAIDRPETNLSLREMTEVAISCLENSKLGFFLMVEGGKIDWACHANDAAATVYDVLDFDDAIGAAKKFYMEHPKETLIVVTGDHETGGMTVGHATTAYSAHYDRLLSQNCSFTYFGMNQFAEHKAAYADGYDYTNPANLAGNSEMLSLMEDAFGLIYSELNDFQKQKLEDAYDQSMCGTNNNSSDENSVLYGYYEPIIVTITHILNENASIGWTSYSHTGVPVPVFAMGTEANLFGGFYDNTDIAKKIVAALKMGYRLPVRKVN